jgi:hypothetical protein
LEEGPSREPGRPHPRAVLHAAAALQELRCVIQSHRSDHSGRLFEAEQPRLVPYAGRFDGFHAVSASVSKTCLVRFLTMTNAQWSQARSVVPVEVHAYADRIVIRQDGRIVGEHRRSFGRGETIYDPWPDDMTLVRSGGCGWSASRCASR